MAFPKHTLLGVRVAIPKQHVKKVRKELLMRVRPVRGEGAQELARRAKFQLRAMGFPMPLTPKSSTEELPMPAGHGNPSTYHQAMELACLQPNFHQALELVPRAQLPPAIDEKESPQHNTTSAIGEKRLAQNCQATLANDMGQSSAQPNCSAAPTSVAVPPRPVGPWTLYSEQGICFKAEEDLGQGTFGKVIGGTLALSGGWANGQAVALKLLTRNPLRIDLDSYVHKEIQALANLAHPCIVHLFGVIFTTFNVQLFLQRHDMSLHQYLLQRPAEAQAKQIAQCILKGLVHMHAAAYVHRDLKPKNILVDCQPLAAVISDLGSAHLGEDALDIATTLSFKAPEIMLGYAYMKASDLWSVGCIVAQVEQLAFFDQPHVECELRFEGRSADFMFMRALALKICPKSKLKFLGSRCQGLSQDLLKLGHVEGGVLGERFSQPTFQPFMERLLHFQPKQRATAENLLGHPWLQTSESCQPLVATSPTLKSDGSHLRHMAGHISDQS